MLLAARALRAGAKHLCLASSHSSKFALLISCLFSHSSFAICFPAKFEQVRSTCVCEVRTPPSSHSSFPVSFRTPHFLSHFALQIPANFALLISCLFSGLHVSMEMRRCHHSAPSSHSSFPVSFRTPHFLSHFALQIPANFALLISCLFSGLHVSMEMRRCHHSVVILLLLRLECHPSLLA